MTQATLEKPQAVEPEEEKGSILRCLLAELFGTFALTFVAAGAEVIAVVSQGQVDHISRMVAPGLLVMAMIYALGDVSGAHFNPAVSLAFTLRRDFPWRKLPLYWITQLAGASLAAWLLKALFGPVKDLGANHPQYGVLPALVIEIVTSTFLITVILGTSSRYQIVGPNAALAVGATIALCGLFASPISGASMNPARSLGPALVAGSFDQVWIYLVGPFTGSLLALILNWLLHGDKKPGENEAAQGKQNQEKP